MGEEQQRWKLEGGFIQGAGGGRRARNLALRPGHSGAGRSERRLMGRGGGRAELQVGLPRFKAHTRQLFHAGDGSSLFIV